MAPSRSFLDGRTVHGESPRLSKAAAVITLGDPFRALKSPGWTELSLMDEQPPGWYRDPENARRHRYWDGQCWAVAQADSADGVEGSDAD